ncbi:hypothetical protein [Leuconostoc pseudomesenteroides]|uniref:hypothetical protein n=1 Tax=Leuconostoc pseudomesenteroides TaxID=33968 RepID=UPI0032DEF44A
MTEPVAYKRIYDDGVVGYGKNKSNLGVENIPLYTAEQLHPRVKMTQKQYDRLMWDKENTDLSTCLGYFLEHDGNSKFGVLTENLLGNLTQEDIARAWLNPEETIEIVPDMKWFVRSKEFDDGVYKVLVDNRLDYYEYSNVNNGEETAEYGYAFDTKEEAEKWTNPLTEAVQFPVEDE